MRQLALCLPALLAACAVQPPVAEVVPPDFSLSLTLVGDQPAPFTSAWYVLEPDGLLRAATGERQNSSVLPPVIRQLSDAQRRDLYLAALQSGAFDAPRGGVQVAESSLPKSGSGAVIFSAAGGARRTRVIDGPATSIEPLARSLRQLAWIDPT